MVHIIYKTQFDKYWYIRLIQCISFALTQQKNVRIHFWFVEWDRSICCYCCWSAEIEAERGIYYRRNFLLASHTEMFKRVQIFLNDTNCDFSPHFYDWIFYRRIYAKWNANNGGWDAHNFKCIPYSAFLTFKLSSSPPSLKFMVHKISLF